MITCHLKGGVGNQMFQIAATEALAKRNNDVAGYNLYTCQTRLQGNPSTHYKDTLFKKLGKIDPYTDSMQFLSSYQEPEFAYHEIPYKPGLVLNGYFQSEKYFTDCADHIRNLFTFEDDTLFDVKNILNMIKAPITSVHIRRGDYLNFPNAHPTCSLDYYKQAMALFPDNVFIIISDDIKWAKDTFGATNHLYLSFKDDLFDLCAMTLCNNNIIANSSFSWWGAWLNQNPDKKVVAPGVWFGSELNHDTKDIYCKDWIII